MLSRSWRIHAVDFRILSLGLDVTMRRLNCDTKPIAVQKNIELAIAVEVADLAPKSVHPFVET